MTAAAAFEPAVGVLTGNWYDTVPLGEGQVGMVVIDVAGHGATSGVLALHAKHLLLPALHQGMEPGEALSWLAETLGAGHPPVLLHRADGMVELGPTGPLVGPVPGSWDTDGFTMAAGDLMVAYTDGVVEARRGDGEEFGDRRLACLVAEHAAGASRRWCTPASTRSTPSPARRPATTSRSWPWPA